MFFQFFSFSRNDWTQGAQKSLFIQNIKYKNIKNCHQKFFLKSKNPKQSKNFINFIFSQLSKLIINNGIKLEKKGKYMVAPCPFHFEKSPSFFVNDKKGVYHCFGCGASGNIFSFQKNLDKTRAFKSKFSPDVKSTNNKFLETFQKKIPDFEVWKDFSLSSFQEFLLLQLSSAFFFFLLKKNLKPKTLLQLRNISFGTAKIFQIGYSPPGQKFLFKYLSDIGFSGKKLIKSGIFFFKKKPLEFENVEKMGSKKLNFHYYDMFQDRFIIPIRNQKGLVIGFGGRLISKTNFPKYLNSPESQIFKKNQNIFSQSMIINSLHNFPKVLLLVEGYIDTMALFQNGIRFSAASLGTSFSFFQINKCKNLCSLKHIIICFDSDSAGENGIFLLLKKNLFESNLQDKTYQFSITEIPSIFYSKDPDEFLQKEGCFNFSNKILNCSVPPMVWFENFIFLKTKENVFFIGHIFSQLNYIKKNFSPMMKKETLYYSFFEKITNSTQKKKKFTKALLKNQSNFFLFKKEKFSSKMSGKDYTFSSVEYFKNDLPKFITDFNFLSFTFLLFRNDMSCIFFSNNFQTNSYFEFLNKKNFSFFMVNPDQNKKSNYFKNIYLFNSDRKINKLTLDIFLQKFFSLETRRLGSFSEKCEILDMTIKETFFSWLIYRRTIVAKKIKKLIFLNNYLKNRKKIQKKFGSNNFSFKFIIEKNINHELKIISSIDRCLDSMRNNKI